jgi:type II secretory pathway pseudopilin PulG
VHRHFEQPKFRARGFTIAEILVSLAIASVVGLVLFSVLQATSVLLAKNTGINLTHGNARLASEKLVSLVQSAAAPPILVDPSLNPVSGDGPSAGITFLRLASRSTYTSVNDVNAPDTTLRLRRTAGMPAPESGDVLVMVGTDSASFATTDVIGFQGSITGVITISATDHTVSFASTIGSLCNPAATSGKVMLNNTKLFLLDKMACVAVQKESVVEKGVTLIRSDLRLANNASTYNASNSATYQVLAQLVQTGGKQPQPFGYSTTDRRWIDMDLRVESTAYNQRQLGTSNTFFDLKESIAYRSAAFVKTSQ